LTRFDGSESVSFLAASLSGREVADLKTTTENVRRRFASSQTRLDSRALASARSVPAFARMSDTTPADASRPSVPGKPLPFCLDCSTSQPLTFSTRSAERGEE